MNETDLLESERQLLANVANGTILDFIQDEDATTTSMQSWGEDRTIRASVIRDILLGRLVKTPDPRGLQIRGATIVGRLDLAYLKVDLPIKMIQCVFPNGIEACDAHLPILMFAGSRITSELTAAVDLSGLNTNQIALNNTSITSNCPDSAVRLVRAHVAGSVGFSRAKVYNGCGPAVRADGLVTARNFVMNKGCVAEGTGEDGAVRLIGATIEGDLICTDTTIKNTSGVGLAADKIRVAQSANLASNLKVVANSDRGAVRLLGAVIGGQFSVSGATFHNNSGPALVADRIKVQDDMYMRHGFAAMGRSTQGAITLTGMIISGALVCADAKLENPDGPALVADSAQVMQDLEIYRTNLRGSGNMGVLRICDAEIGGKLGLADSVLHNASGPAVDGDRIHVRQGLFMEPGLHVVGAGAHGAVRLINAKIDAGFQCIGTTIQNDSGPAILADSMHIAANLDLDDGFAAVSDSPDAAIKMLGARIGGQIQLVSRKFAEQFGSRACRR